MRDEGDRCIDIIVGMENGKDITIKEDGKTVMNIEIDPIFNAIYKDFKENPSGLTTYQILSKSYGSYKRRISDKEINVSLSQKNVIDYISRLNKELQEKGVPLEYRIQRSGTTRYIPYLKLKYVH